MTIALFPWVVASALALTPADLPIDGSVARVNTATMQVVGGILEFTHWPDRPDPVRVCVAGIAVHAGEIASIRLTDGRAVRRVDLRVGDSGAVSGCDAVYLGTMTSQQMRTWTAASRGNPIVTIAESDPSCRSEAMFCLIYEPRFLSFRMSIDAIARSGVRIDPRVLRLSRGGAGQ